MGRRERWSLALLLAAGAAIGGFLARRVHGPEASAQPPAPYVSDVLMKTQEAFRELSKRVSPSIVHITTKMKVQVFSPFFMPFDAPEEQESEGIGSGVIVDDKGYILTNNHVVSSGPGARPALLRVRFTDGKEAVARIVGADPDTDLAVIKIDPPKGLRSAVLGNSDEAEVGDWVLAIGSPFGLDQTVTFGIISAKGRRQGMHAYEDYIQTDAAINPGNSGGALVNCRGEVIGINSMIVTQTRNNAGIGLAIPSNMARSVMDQLISKGKVVRGYLGIVPAEIDENLAKRYGLKDTAELLDNLGMSEPYGAFILEAPDPNQPAGKAGILEGDVIVAVDGKKVENVAQLLSSVAMLAPGTKATLEIFRDRKKKSLTATVGERPSGTVPKPQPRRKPR